ERPLTTVALVDDSTLCNQQRACSSRSTTQRQSGVKVTRDRRTDRSAASPRSRTRLLDGPKADVGARNLDVRPVPRVVWRSKNAKLVIVIAGYPAPKSDPARFRRGVAEIAVVDHDVECTPVGVQRGQGVRTAATSAMRYASRSGER